MNEYATSIRSAALFVGLASGATAQTQVLEVGGAVAQGHFGARLAALGDVNGDAIPDLAVGAQGEGVIRMLSGATGTVIWSVSGLVGTSFGFGLGAVGDQNGDGVSDLAVGTPAFFGMPVRVYSGASGALLLTIANPVLESDIVEVAGAGDVNADGVLDIVVGDAKASAGASNSGAIHVFSLGSGALLFSKLGTQFSGLLGSSVSSLGDANGDGRDDVIVGAPGYVGNIPFAGSASLLSGAGGVTLQHYAGSVAQQKTGASVAACADLNGDGIAEFGYSQGWNGSPGAVRVHSAATGALLREYTGMELSAPIAFGDVDGDGIADLVAHGGQLSVMFGGQIQVYSGNTGKQFLAVLNTEGGSDYGSSVAVVGDLDGDGAAEFAAGARFSDKLVQNGGVVKVHSHAGLTIQPFGLSCAGSGGFKPVLSLSLQPSGAVQLAIHGGVGGAAAVLLIGSMPGYKPYLDVCDFHLGGQPLLLIPPFVLSGVGPGAGTFTIATPTPIPAGLGLFFPMQVFLSDQGVFPQYTATNAVLLTVP